MVTKFDYLDKNTQNELTVIADKLCKCGKGIFCADESKSEINCRLRNNCIPPTDGNRRAYRELLFSTNAEISLFVSGVVLTHETLYEKTENGIPFIRLLKDRHLLIGVNVDEGTIPIMGTECESTTQGLLNLAQRCCQYKEDGCDFAKWRCTFRMRDNAPSLQAMVDNATVLARFASICQSVSMVPLCEVHISPLDSDHDLKRAQKVTETVFSILFKTMNDHHVFLEGMLLRTNPIVAGEMYCKEYSPGRIGCLTVKSFRRTIPPALPGIFFIDGKGSEEAATVQLNSINNSPFLRPWLLSFAYGRALQTRVLRVWAGKSDKVKDAQDELLMRAQANSLAALGKYTPGSVQPSDGCFGFTLPLKSY